MAVRKLSDLYFPNNLRLTLDNGSWYLYSTDMVCYVQKIDRRLALKLVREHYVTDKRLDDRGRIMYKPVREKLDK